MHRGGSRNFGLVCKTPIVGSTQEMYTLRQLLVQSEANILPQFALENLVGTDCVPLQGRSQDFLRGVQFAEILLTTPT